MVESDRQANLTILGYASGTHIHPGFSARPIVGRVRNPRCVRSILWSCPQAIARILDHRGSQAENAY